MVIVIVIVVCVENVFQVNQFDPWENRWDTPNVPCVVREEYCHDAT